MDGHIQSDYYGTDFLVWLNIQAKLLRTKQFDQLDLENLAEEIEGMARMERREFKQRIERLIVRLLKCEMQPDRVSGRWAGKILQQRYRINDLLEEMPSLRPQLDGFIAETYPHAMARAADQNHLPKTAFPAEPPFTPAQLLDEDYMP